VPQDDAVSLSSELEELIRGLYAPQEQSSVRATLMSYAAANPGAVTDRVQFDLLHLGAGDAEQVKRLAGVAAQDPRDVMSGEYFWTAGRSYPHPWARRHPVNRDWVEPPKQNAEPLCTAELFFRWQPGGSSGAKPLKLPSLVLAFANDVSLMSFGNQVLKLTEHDRVIDLSSALQFQNRLSPESTVLRCVRGGEPETLAYDGEVLTWSGDAEYWTACHFKCLRLAESGDGFRDMMTGRATGQRIRISLRATAQS
jgi:hypothetical protein